MQVFSLSAQFARESAMLKLPEERRRWGESKKAGRGRGERRFSPLPFPPFLLPGEDLACEQPFFPINREPVHSRASELTRLSDRLPSITEYPRMTRAAPKVSRFQTSHQLTAKFKQHNPRRLMPVHRNSNLFPLFSLIGYDSPL